jgi:predicted murein hydrolase (TIGR00659 family)
MDDVEFFVYLRTSPLTALTATLVAYQAGVWLQRRANGNPLVNPVLIAVTVLVAVLEITGTSYRRYFAGAQFINFLLGPAVVALAIPLHRRMDLIRRAARPIALAVAAGGLVAMFSAAASAWLFGAPEEVVRSLAPKSTTAPVALGLSKELGGIPALTAALTILTGIIGAILGQAVAGLVRVRDERALGLALGVASHGIGTARALQLSETAGAFASLGFALNATFTAAVLPLLADGLGVI